MSPRPQRISATWTSHAPTQAASAVSASRPRSRAKAREARSPSDRPRERVGKRSSPQIFACDSVNGAISRSMSANDFRIMSSEAPRSTSFVKISARLTLDINPPGMDLRTTSAPGSPRSIARIAELSNTNLVTFGFRPPLGYEFVNHRGRSREIGRQHRLRAAHIRIEVADDKLRIDNFDQQSISRCVAKFSTHPFGNAYRALCIESELQRLAKIGCVIELSVELSHKPTFCHKAGVSPNSLSNPSCRISL